jgi:hypothetical protein
LPDKMRSARRWSSTEPEATTEGLQAAKPTLPSY